METRSKLPWLLTLGSALILGLATLASARDADDDGVIDPCDICPATDPDWADYPSYAVTLTAEGCADRDSDGVSDWRDDCPTLTPLEHRHDFLLDERGCWQQKWVHVRTSAPVEIAYNGDPHSSRRWWPADPTDFVMGCPVGPVGGRPDALYFSGSQSHNAVYFRPYDDGRVELWSDGDVAATNEEPNLRGGSDVLYYYDLPPYSYPTEPCQIVTYGMQDPGLDGITVTIWAVYDSDGDGVLDADDDCPGTPPFTPVDANGCPLPDADSDGVPDTDDLCPDSDPCYAVSFNGCLDTDIDGVEDVNDLCADSPLGATVSIEGCYDADGDGVAIRYDKCPDTPANDPINSDGCTDTDGDGLPDTDDLCNDPCTWIDENGCPDRDLDGIADSDDSCPDQGGQVCRDGCPDPCDSDGDGVSDCLDICDDPCTLVDVNGCPDSDLDDIADVNDLCPGTHYTTWVGSDGCQENRDVWFDTDGPLFDDDQEPPYSIPSWVGVLPGQDEDFPFGVAYGTGEMMFSLVPRTNPVFRVYYRIYPDGTTGIWDDLDIAHWNKLRQRPGGDPITGLKNILEGHANRTVDMAGYPVDHIYHTTGVGALPGWPTPFNMLFVEDVDTDGDGVRDFFDECPDSNLLKQDVDEVGCPLWPKCNDKWRPSPRTDIDTDCYVNENDLILMAEQWLTCVDPLDQDCIQLQPSPEEMYPDIMYMHDCGPGGRTVDGQLGDWSDPCWIALDQIYTGDPNDVLSAKYAVCWDPCDDLFYAAVQVVDTDHVFETAPTNWHTSDRVEIYVQADPNGGNKWGSEQTDNYDKAQQYIIGYQGLLDWTWAVFGHGTYLPGDFEPFNAHFADAGRISGDTITYEISAKAWQWYGGLTPAVDPNVVRQLEPGVQVGFDVVADSRRGTAPHDDYEFGMLSANLMTQKFIFAEKFQRWELLDYDGTVVPPECGDWGYLTADVNPIPDCYVDMTDFEQLSSQWMDCTDPCSPCGFIP